MFKEFLINEQSVTNHISHTDEHIYLTYFNETEEVFDSCDYRVRDYYVTVYNLEDLTYYGEIPIEDAIIGSTHEGNLIELVDDDPENFTLRFYDVTSEE